ncbi:signal peptidase II [Desulfobulbus sp. F5]|jgi:signal peptidase II|nr:signal peptidase II [Desulfobulbus sp. F5]
MLRFLLIMGLTIVSDQLTKLWVVESFALYDTTPVIPGVFNLTLLHNTGAAFGIMSGLPLLWRQVFFVGIATVALAVMVIMQRRMGGENPLYAISFGLISGGAIGNVIDRIKQGSVIDFLDFHLGTHHWPAFNVADSGITVGVGIFLLLQFFEERAAKRKLDQNAQQAEK